MLFLSSGRNQMLANKVQAIVLAAGKSTRFNTGKTKLLEKLCGQEMILYTTQLLTQLNIPVTLIVGYQKDSIEEVVRKAHTNSVSFVVQEEQRGTGHAVMCSQSSWNKELLLVMNGDMPLVPASIIEKLYETHHQNNADISFVTAHVSGDARGYGRVINNGQDIAIVEEKDFIGDISEHCCVNAGIYLIKKSFLQEHINELPQSAVSKEFYITDLIKVASKKGKKVATLSAPFDQVRGVNTFHELWAAEHIKRGELIKSWMDKGVHFSVAQNVHIDLDVIIGSGTFIGCGVHLLRGTVIGTNSTIHEFTALENAHIGNSTEILAHTIIKDSTVGNNAIVGPFAHVREHSSIGDFATIGNFVEIKKSTLGNGTKAKHLSYLGDASIGNQVNIGAGTITCNHDGQHKHATQIGNDAYIGSNNTLVAPLTISANAFTAAGSVITQDVPQDALAIARARQVNKEGYAKKLRNSSTESDSFMGAIKTLTTSCNTEQT